MNNLAKLIVTTGYKNNRKLLLRLCCSADCIRSVNYQSREILNNAILIRTEQFISTVNTRTYGLQLENENIEPQEKNSFSDEKKIEVRMSENQHARNVLLNSIYYTKTILAPNKFNVIVKNEEALKILETDWSKAELCELVSAFRKLSYNIMGDDTCLYYPWKCDNIFNTLNERIPDLTDSMLEEILKCLIPFSKHSKLPLKKTFDLLDKECQKRYKKWPLDKMLLMADIFYCLDIHRESDFMWQLMRKMNTKLNQLTPKNLVQLLYLVNIIRKSKLNMYEVEVRLEDCLEELSIQELGIVAMGFFKSKSKIRNSIFLRNIINHLMREINNVDSISLAALLKLIRFSMHFNEIIHFRMLLNSIVSIIPKLESMCLMHIAHSCATALVYEKPLIDAIIERMYNEIEDTRIKDIEKLAFMLSTFDIDREHPIYDKIVKEVTKRINCKKTKEMSAFPLSFLNIAQYLAIKDIYPFHLLEIVMSPDHVKSTRARHDQILASNYSLLHYSVRIERPEYTGPFIEEGLIRTLTKLHWKFGDNNISLLSSKMSNEVMYAFKEVIANDVDLYIGKLLPHFLHNDIVIAIDENHNFISTKPILSELNDLSPKKINDTFPKNVKWIALVIVNYGHTIRGTNKPTGMIMARLRQLQLIGYTPVLITDNEWLRFKELKEKGLYLKDLINNA